MFFGRKNARKNRRLINTAPAAIETFENRTVLAASVTATLSKGVLAIEGTSRDDIIVVRYDKATNVISIDNVAISGSGGIGKIQVNARGGNDNVSLEGVPIACTVLGGSGRDSIVGGLYADELNGNSGNDTLIGDGGSDTLYGDENNDHLWGGSGNDRLDGGTGNDTLQGGADDDYLNGRIGNDYLNGGSGDDYLRGESGFDTITCGTGIDRVGANLNQDTLTDMATTRYRFEFNWRAGDAPLRFTLDAPPGNHFVDGSLVSYTAKNSTRPQLSVGNNALIYSFPTSKFSSGQVQATADLSYVRDGITVNKE